MIITEFLTGASQSPTRTGTHALIVLRLYLTSSGLSRKSRLGTAAIYSLGRTFLECCLHSEKFSFEIKVIYFPQKDIPLDFGLKIRSI